MSSLVEYRLDYITKSGNRGVWEYELEDSEEEIRRDLPETLKYAQSRMPDIEKLVIVVITERDLD